MTPRVDRCAGQAPDQKLAKRRGQGLVELTLALPMLLLILLGTIDLGRMYFDYVQMRNGAREGSGYAARNMNDPNVGSGITSRVRGHGVPADAAISYTCDDGSCTTLNGTGSVTARVERTFVPVTTAFLGRFGLGSVRLNTAASMRMMT